MGYSKRLNTAQPSHAAGIEEDRVSAFEPSRYQSRPCERASWKGSRRKLEERGVTPTHVSRSGSAHFDAPSRHDGVPWKISCMKDLFEVLKPGGNDWVLAESIDPERLPAHIALIMDGNGRWARRRNLPRVAGHRAGMEPVRVTVQTCAQLGVQALTLYAFSTENWKRPPFEVDMLWRLLQVFLRREISDLMRNDVVFNCVGRFEVLPGPVRREIESAMERTSHNQGLRLNLAVNYSGRAELVDALNAIVEDARRDGAINELRITEQAISERLYTAGMPDPDLLIRTSGEMRISNFLLWQIAYSEIYVTDTLWPDFSRTDLLRAILEFQKRDRRFGGLSPEPPDVEAELIQAAGVAVR